MGNKTILLLLVGVLCLFLVQAGKNILLLLSLRANEPLDFLPETEFLNVKATYKIQNSTTSMLAKLKGSFAMDEEVSFVRLSDVIKPARPPVAMEMSKDSVLSEINR